MPATIRLSVHQRCQIEITAATPIEAVERLAAFQEILCDRACGSCGSERIRFDHRRPDGNDYFCVRCLDCGARLDFGRHKTGDTLFAKRNQGKNGWYHYRVGDESSSAG